MAKNQNPKAISFVTEVAVPVTKTIRVHTCSMRDISLLENFFIAARDSTEDVTTKREYDLCRATLKWAQTCNASLIETIYAVLKNESVMKFTFSFNSADELKCFVESLEENVTGAVI